ncbi:craniofacial development protein 2-like [Polyodon spathula]|uniref:craniofacial development protein 2-like n=1 Tax=Polyodon spathula TaxID=7913 RepID=UPI001B7F73E9|nr:craniofacial development protein 2-like [Polyodon spathula]
MVPNGRPPRPVGIQKVTGEEQGSFTSNPGFYDANGGNPSGSPDADAACDERKNLRCMKTHKISTWNVRGMSQGKLDIIKQEMIRLNIDLLGISELHWKDNGHFQSDNFSVYYSGHQELRRNGVAVIAHKNIAHTVESYATISDRIMAIRIRGKPLNVTVLQVYAPKTDAPEDESERFYAKIEEALEQVPKKDIIYIMGDFNAKVGSHEEVNIIGRCGLGERNDAGDHLVQFCHENHLRVSNTWFIQPKRHLYTWTAPNGQHCNQIDYILCSRCWKSSVLAIKTFPSADYGSDHELLVATIKVKFCNIKKNAPPKRFDVSKVPVSYAVAVKNRFKLLGNANKQPDKLWQEFQSTIIKTAQEHIPYKKLEKRSKWLSAETIKIAAQRRAAKAAGDRDEARRLNAEFQSAARKDKKHTGISDASKWRRTVEKVTPEISLRRSRKFDILSLPAKEQSKTRTGRS